MSRAVDQSHWSGFRSRGLASDQQHGSGSLGGATGRHGRGGQPCPGRGKAALGEPWGRPPLGLAPGDAAAALGRASPIAFLNRPPPLFSQRAPALRAGEHAALQIGDVRRRRRSRRRRRHFDACGVRKFEKLATPRAQARIAAVAPPGPTSPSPPPCTACMCCGRASAAGSDASFSLAGPATNELGGATAATARASAAAHTAPQSGPFCAAGGVRPVGLSGRSGGLGGCCCCQNPDLGPQ